jgi:hypothetical protein
MNGARHQRGAGGAPVKEQTMSRLRPTVKGRDVMFRIYEWNFSATAEAVIGFLLAITLVATMFV